MTITYSMLYVLLKSRCPLVDISVSTRMIPIRAAKIYRGVLEPEILYIVPEVGKFSVPEKAGDQAFVFLETDALGLRLPEGAPAVLLGNWHESDETMAMLTELILTLERWQSELYRLNLDNATPGMMLRKMYDMIPRRLVFENENRRHIYEYPAYESSPDESSVKYAADVSASPAQPDYASFQQFILMSSNRSVYSVEELPHVEILNNREIGNYFVARKCFENERRLGNLYLVYDGEPSDRTLMDGYCRIVDVFCRSFEHLLSASARGAVQDGNDALHNSFYSLLFSPSQEQTRIVLGYLSELDWSPDDSYMICAIQIESSSVYLEVSGYLCGLFEKEIPNCIALRAKGQIILLINTSKGADFEETIIELVRRLRQEASLRNIYAAFSNPFDNLLLASGYYLQCDYMLKHCRVWSLRDWVFYYRDHSMDYIAAHLSSHFALEYICHPGVLALYRYDKEHDTELTNTLYYFMKFHMNTSEAANAIPVHRTTFTKRMEKIDSICRFNYQSVDECLHILLSLKMLYGTEV